MSKVRLSVCVDGGVAQAVRQFARANGRTASNAVNFLLRKGVNTCEYPQSVERVGAGVKDDGAGTKYGSEAARAGRG